MEKNIKLKFCYSCREYKDENLFYNDKSHLDGKSTHCKKCDYLYKKQWRKDNPERAKAKQNRKYARAKKRNPDMLRNRWIKWRYGITFDDFQELRIQQGFRCLICKVHQDDLKICLNIDHDEEQNIIRGLLCNNCNRAIGEFQHSIVILQNAINYLSKPISVLPKFPLLIIKKQIIDANKVKNGFKQCTTCREIKEVKFFSKTPLKYNSSGYASLCKRCVANGRMKRVYGITYDQYDYVLEQQKYKCAICTSFNAGGRGIFHIDHNHFTNKFRGLLCFNCNHALGLLHESIPNLQEAIQYLKKYEEEVANGTKQPRPKKKNSKAL